MLLHSFSRFAQLHSYIEAWVYICHSYHDTYFASGGSYTPATPNVSVSHCTLQFPLRRLNQSACDTVNFDLWGKRFFLIVSWRGGRWGRGQESENNADQNSDLGYRYLYCYKCIQYFLKEKQVSIFKTVEGGQRRREVSTQASKVTAIDSETWGIRGEGLLLLMHCKQRKRRKEGTGEKVKV